MKKDISGKKMSFVTLLDVVGLGLVEDYQHLPKRAFYGFSPLNKLHSNLISFIKRP